MTSADDHRLRIALKKLRYSVELFGSLFDERDVSGYLARLAPLQDALGLANDLRVAHELIADWPGKGSGASVKRPAAQASSCSDGMSAAWPIGNRPSARRSVA